MFRCTSSPTTSTSSLMDNCLYTARTSLSLALVKSISLSMSDEKSSTPSILAGSASIAMSSPPSESASTSTPTSSESPPKSPTASTGTSSASVSSMSSSSKSSLIDFLTTPSISSTATCRSISLEFSVKAFLIKSISLNASLIVSLLFFSIFVVWIFSNFLFST